MYKNNLFLADWFPPFKNWWMETHASAYIDYMWDKIIPYSFTLQSNFNKKEIIDKYNLTKVNFSLPIESITNPDVLLDIISKNSPNYIFFNSIFWIKIVEQIKKFNHNIKLILRSGWNDISQSNIQEPDTLEWRRWFVVDAINSSIDLLIVNSRFTKNMFSNYWINSEKMKIITGWVDTNKFFPVSFDEKMKIREMLSFEGWKNIGLSVSRLVEFKNIKAVLEVAENIVKDENNIFIIVWWWPLLDKVKNYVRIKNLSKKIFVLWEIPVQDIPKYYQMSNYFLQMSTYCKVFVSSSKVCGESYIHTETMGRSVMEAMSCWLPIVATNVWWVPEVVKDWWILIPDKDISKAVDSILEINKNKCLWINLGNRAREIAYSEYSWEKIFNSYNF